jgi:NitT/TauT family transport system substrate-binding protein
LSPQALTALLVGEGTANMSAPGELLGANAKGQRIKVIESYTQFEPVYLVVSKQFAQKYNITAESPLQTREAALKAAVGARLGITAPGSISDMVTRLAVKQVSLNPARDVSIVPLGNLMNVISAMSANTIEGGIVYSPMAEQTFVDLGCVPLLSVAKGEIPLAKRMQGQVLEARAEDAAARPEVFEKIVRADLKALKVIKEEPNKARDLLRATRFTAVREDIWPNVWQNHLPAFVTPYVAEESLRAWIQTGLIGGNPDPDKFPYSEVIDMRFVESGLKQLGWSLQRS